MKKLKRYIDQQKVWSKKTFGDGMRTEGLCKHIEKEVDEIRNDPSDLYEYIDVIILALDGAWRAGYEPGDIVQALYDKQRINFTRQWPPVVNGNEPSEHIREVTND